MARDGSGNYNLPAGNPVVTGTVISSTQFNSTMTDIATAMTQSISKDGQTTPTNNLPMGGNKHTGVQDGNLGNQYASINQTQNGSLSKATSVANVVDAFTAALTPAIASYTDGQFVTLTPSVTNTTTTVTLALNGLAAKPVNKEAGVACAIGDIVLNVPIYLVYYATGGYFLLLNPQRITGARLSTPVLLSGTGELFRFTTTTARGSGLAYLDFFDPTGVKGYLGYVLGTDDYYVSNALTGALNLQTAGSTRVAVGSGGNVTVSAPTGGISALINGLSANYVLQLASTSANGVLGFGWNVGNTANAWNLFSQGSDPLSVGTNGTQSLFLVTAGATRVNINGNGGVIVNTPTSGNAVTINGVAGAATLSIVAPNTASNSNGIGINAGTNSSDVSLNIFNAAGTLNSFKVRGDGVVFGNDGTNLFELGFKDTPINSQAGSYTLVASDRGKTIAVASGATITIPNSVFAAGATISFVINSGISATLAQGSGVTLAWTGNGSTTGNRTFTGAGLATVLFTSASTAFISGAGLT